MPFSVTARLKNYKSQVLYLHSKAFHPLAAGDSAVMYGSEHPAAFQRPENEVARRKVDHVHAELGRRQVMPLPIETRYHQQAPALHGLLAEIGQGIRQLAAHEPHGRTAIFQHEVKYLAFRARMERSDNALALSPLRYRPLFLDNAPHAVQLPRRKNADARTGLAQQFHIAYRLHSHHLEFLHLYSFFFEHFSA